MIEDKSIEIAVSGSSWLGKGDISIWSMLEETFAIATQEVSIATYSVSENSSMIFDFLEKLLHRRLPILFLINRFRYQPEFVRERLQLMNDKFVNLTLLNFEPKNQAEDLHAKLIVIDSSIALVGSANLTWKGLVNNHEVMVRISGKPAWNLARLIDHLSSNPNTILIRKKGG